MKKFGAILATSFSLAVVPPNTPLNSTVELHSHLFMNEGMTWAFHGDFEGPLKANSWDDGLSSQANPEALEKSGIHIVVATLYAHPLFSLSMRESVRRQIAQAEKFVTTHPGWIIARDADEASKALNEGKRVMVLALEGAAGVIENDRDLDEFITQRGIRIVTLLHLMDDRFGGIAFLRGLRALTSPLAYLKSALKHQAEGPVLNSQGLTPEGRKMTCDLIDRGVWLDLAHASDTSKKEMIEILEASGQPLLYTHMPLRKYYGAERGITEEQMIQVGRSGGILGLMPSEEMLEGTPLSDRANCNSGVFALAQQYTEAARLVGPTSAMLGSDTNGAIPHLKPSCKTGTALDHEGFWNIGQTGDVWAALQALGAPVPKPLNLTVGTFLKAWRRVRPNQGNGAQASCTTSRK